MEKEIKIGAIIDIETTGLSPYLHEVIEVSILKFQFHLKTGEIQTIVDEFHALNQPSSPLPIMISKLTGITDEMLDGERLSLSDLITYCKDIEYFVAHNASFDRSFMVQVFPEIGERNWYCSMRSIRWKEYGFQNKKLQTLLDGHQIKNDNAHRASSDTRCTLELLKQLNPTGQSYFKELLLKKPMKKPNLPVQKRANTYTGSLNI